MGQNRDSLEFPGPAREPQVRTSSMRVAQRWELALKGAGAPGPACLSCGAQVPFEIHWFTLVGCWLH